MTPPGPEQEPDSEEAAGATSGGVRPPVGPIGGQVSTIVLGLSTRLRIPYLVDHHDNAAIMGLFALVNGVTSIAIMAAAAVVSGQPFIFPSLGPTAFLFFYTPLAPAASPRNAFGGHLIGVVAGYVGLMIFGLTDAGPTFAEGVSWARVGAAAFSLGVTSGVMVWARVPHPPAGATTLIVSLGIMSSLRSLVVLMVAVMVLSLQAIVINRLAGLDYPVWAPRPAD